MTPKEYVLSKMPNAIVRGPVDMYWPGTGKREGRYIVLASSAMSGPEGEGSTPEEAWQNAEQRIRNREKNDGK